MNMLFKYIPILETIKNYNRRDFNFDLIAALTVAVVALPQSMAYAMIAGVSPAYGLYTAIILSIIGSMMGSSNHLNTGPTNAICLLIAGIMVPFAGKNNFFEMLCLLTFMVGAIQFALGALRLGSLVNYVSHSLIIGFTAGAGILIALQQLNSLLGISIKGNYSTIEKVALTLQNIDKTNYYSLGLGLLTIGTILICKFINNKLPGALLGVIASTAAVIIFHLDQAGVKLTGDIPSAIPPFGMLHFSGGELTSLASGAMVIAIIGLVEAVSISKAISSLTHQKIDPNQEFMGQGLSNIVGSFFSCIPGSGSFTRSAVTYQSGGKTRMVGVLAGLSVLAALICIKPWAKFIPGASLAGVLMIVAYSMVDKKAFKKILATNRNDAAIMLVTAIITVLAPQLEYAIYIGVALSLILYLKESSVASVKTITPVKAGEVRFGEKTAERSAVGKDTTIIQLGGNLYFGSATDLEQKLSNAINGSSVYELNFSGVTLMDMTSLEIIENFINRVLSEEKRIILTGINSNIKTMLDKADITKHVGSTNIFMQDDALADEKYAKGYIYAAG